MKGKKLPALVTIGVLTLVTVLTWVISDLVRTLTKKPETKVSEKILEPLNPTLDQDALGKIQNALFFDDSVLSTLPSPNPSEEPIPTPSEEAIIPSPLPAEEPPVEPETSPLP